MVFFAEDLPEDFGFSDTAFRVFILIVLSDRFFTQDYRPKIYTQFGLVAASPLSKTRTSFIWNGKRLSTMAEIKLS